MKRTGREGGRGDVLGREGIDGKEEGKKLQKEEMEKE
jgi:hypothetical protein